jgi:hypothetical protein
MSEPAPAAKPAAKPKPKPNPKQAASSGASASSSSVARQHHDMVRGFLLRPDTLEELQEYQASRKFFVTQPKKEPKRE